MADTPSEAARQTLPAYLPLAGTVLLAAVFGGKELLAPAEGSVLTLWVPAWVLVGSLAALHRPWGGATAGLGTLILAPAQESLGAVAAALVLAAAFLTAELTRGLFLRRQAAERSHRSGRALLGVAPVLAAALCLGAMASAGWLSPARAGAGGPVRSLISVAAAAAVYAAVHFLVARLTASLEGEGWRLGLPDLAAELRPLSVDAAGLGIGMLLIDAVPAIGWGGIFALALAFALLAAEAARHALSRVVSENRAGRLERMRGAHARILGETSGTAGIARQILIECRNVLPVEWFQFELLPAGSPQGTRQSWAAGPDGLLREARPQPPKRPRALPGIHRRAEWRILEKPLEMEGETLAVVRIWCDPRRLEPPAEELLSALVPQMASSVHRARLDREAKIDLLTGVPVRRVLDGRLQAAYRGSCKNGRPVAVILCDVDFFKRINDTYGHAVGDEALILIARTLESQRRESDLCCRYGGEEFAVLVENGGGETALQLAERLRQAIEDLELTVEGERVPLTLSAGVASFPEIHVKTASELLLFADEALYEAKKRGRNRCLLHLGRGAFRDPQGDLVGTAEAPEIELPRFFG